LDLRVQRFERSAAIEPFDRTQGRLLERPERTSVLNSVPIPDVATLTPPFPKLMMAKKVGM
jgi:hypothetical protein